MADGRQAKELTNNFLYSTGTDCFLRAPPPRSTPVHKKRRRCRHGNSCRGRGAEPAHGPAGSTHARKQPPAGRASLACTFEDQTLAEARRRRRLKVKVYLRSCGSDAPCRALRYQPSWPGEHKAAPGGGPTNLAIFVCGPPSLMNMFRWAGLQLQTHYAPVLQLTNPFSPC